MAYLKLNLRRFPDPILNKRCEEIVAFDEQLSDEARQMIAIMAEEKGVGLAANQVGLLKRLIVVISQDGSPLVMVNLVIKSREGNLSVSEGCLSLPGIRYVLPNRSELVVVGYQSLTGEKMECVLNGIQALCAQHEIDHLNGLTMLDSLSPLKALRAKTKLIKQGQRNA